MTCALHVDVVEVATRHILLLIDRTCSELSFSGSPHTLSLRLLGNRTLQIVPAEVVALLGANGAGKSTLVKISAGSQSQDGELHCH